MVAAWWSLPVKVKVFTVPMLLKNGTTVRRTKRRSLETTAWTVMKVPAESTTITGCWAAAKSPTTGITLITKGVCVVSETNACWPLNSVTLGACSTLLRRVALGGLDEEVGLDVAENGKSQRGAGRGVETAELRHRQGVTALGEGDVEVGREACRCPARAASTACDGDRRAADMSGCT